MNHLDSASAPLADAILRAVRQERIPFHMPGHRAGRGLPPALAACFGQLDTTELPDTDDLAHPAGMLREAQHRAAMAFGAARSHLLVNGSTVGILAMVHCVAGPGDCLLVGRDCHRSVLHALRLAGTEPVFVGVPAASGGMLPCGPSADDFLRAAERHPEARGVLLTRPNYYGTAVDIGGFAQALRERDMRLLVDEAHGAHFAADPRFPATALAMGADLVVQSLHKTLPSPSQTALLHEGHAWPGVRPGLPVASVAEAIALFQTSSPSWPLLALADAAVAWFSAHGAEAYAALLDRIESLTDRIGGQGGTFADREGILHDGAGSRFRLAGPDRLPEGCSKDPTRLVVTAPDCGMALERRLRESAGIVAEMADPDHVVLIATPFHDAADFGALADALDAAGQALLPESGALSTECGANTGMPAGAPEGAVCLHAGKAAGMHPEPESLPETVLSLTAAVRLPRESIPLAEAVGRIAAVAVVPYPPGVAAIVPGERYDGPVVARLIRMADAGVSLSGLADGQCLCVMEAGRT